MIKSATLDTETYIAATSQLFALQRTLDAQGLRTERQGEDDAEGAADTQKMDVDTVGSLSKSPTSYKLMGSSAPVSTSISSSFGGRRQMPAADSRIEQTGVMDEDWLVETGKAAHTERQKLDAELKQYQSNLIKESCRVRSSWPYQVCTLTHIPYTRPCSLPTTRLPRTNGSRVTPVARSRPTRKRESSTRMRSTSSNARWASSRSRSRWAATTRSSPP